MTTSNVALVLGAVPVNKHCVGSRWVVCNKDYLGQLIALVSMGQALKASIIIREFDGASPDVLTKELCDEAQMALRVQDPPATPRTGYPRFQRDGFMFEVISWVAAHQGAKSAALIQPPHISSTSQGIDGLLLEIDPITGEIKNATIFEDKCTDDPRGTFLSKVLPAFKDRHSNKRSAELVAVAASLIASAGISQKLASAASGKILDKSVRAYRAAFAVSKDFDSEERRSFLFGRYEEIDGMTADQRIAACFVVDGPVRAWFDEVADIAIDYMETLKGTLNV